MPRHLIVSFSDYQKILDDRPVKFTPEEVNFHKAKLDEEPCASCIHWFHAPIRDTNVCEIMRPADEDVPPNWTCAFHTKDGEHYPYQEER